MPKLAIVISCDLPDRDFAGIEVMSLRDVLLERVMIIPVLVGNEGVARIDSRERR